MVLALANKIIFQSGIPFMSIDAILKERMKAIGFKKKGIIYIKDYDGASIWIGLGKTKRGNEMSIFPVIGIKYQSIIELGRLLDAYNDSQVEPSTLSMSLIYLTPENADKTYYVSNCDGDKLTYDRIFNDLCSYGIPFFEGLTNIDGAIQFVEQNSLELFGKHEFLPLAYYLKGKQNEAIVIAEKIYHDFYFDARKKENQYLSFLEALKCNSSN